MHTVCLLNFKPLTATCITQWPPEEKKKESGNEDFLPPSLRYLVPQLKTVAPESRGVCQSESAEEAEAARLPPDSLSHTSRPPSDVAAAHTTELRPARGRATASFAWKSDFRAEIVMAIKDHELTLGTEGRVMSPARDVHILGNCDQITLCDKGKLKLRWVNTTYLLTSK